MTVRRTGLITVSLIFASSALASPRSLLVPKELRRTYLVSPRARSLASMPGAHYPTQSRSSISEQVAPAAASAAAAIDLRGLREILLRNAVTIPEAILSPRTPSKPFVLPATESVAAPLEFGAVKFGAQNPNRNGSGGKGAGGGGGGSGSPSGSPSGGNPAGGGPQDHNGGPQAQNGLGRDLNGDRGGQRSINPGDFFKEFPNQGDGFTVPPPGTQEPEGFAPVSSELIPAGTNGNPAWSYRSKLPGGVYEGCQATLVSTQDNVCRAATAAHCLEDALKVYGGRFNPQVGMHEGVAHITTANFGQVKAKIFLNSKYVNGHGTGGNDSALMAWPCEASEVKVPVVPIADDLSPLSDGARMFYGKVMGGREGLYSGSAQIDSSMLVNGIRDGVEHLKMTQVQGKAIQQGDSGGPALIGSPGNLRLYGVLSTRDATSEPQGNYSVGPTMVPVALAARLSGSVFGFPSTSQEPPLANSLAAK